jgi:hypothetical protein
MSKTARYTVLYLLAAAISLALCACDEGVRCATASGVLYDGSEDRASLSFSMNRRPVRLEVFLKLDGGKALVTIDHPDGRTSESLPVEGAGVHELRRELPKEPGSWGLGVFAQGGSVAYWYALHDSSQYLGPNDEAKRVVGSD